MSKKRPTRQLKETDDAYFLKLLIYLVLGLIWIKHNGYMIFPLGLVLGIIIAQKDHFAIDRKIEYAMLIIATLVGMLGAGLILNI
jgi:hypothetical protein